MNNVTRSALCALWIAVSAASAALAQAPNAPNLPAGAPSASPAPAVIEMPRLLNLPVDQAVEALKAAGHVGTVTFSPNPPPAGAVVKMQDAVGGTELDPNRALILIVAVPSGPPPMPKLVGQPRARAEMLLHRAGLMRNVTWKTAPAPTRGEGGLVIGQKPDANSEIKPGTAVEVTVGTARK